MPQTDTGHLRSQNAQEPLFWRGCSPSIPEPNLPGAISRSFSQRSLSASAHSAEIQHRQAIPLNALHPLSHPLLLFHSLLFPFLPTPKTKTMSLHTSQGKAVPKTKHRQIRLTLPPQTRTCDCLIRLAPPSASINECSNRGDDFSTNPRSFTLAKETFQTKWILVVKTGITVTSTSSAQGRESRDAFCFVGISVDVKGLWRTSASLPCNGVEVKVMYT
ncbi:hypothetical protein IWX90DRAFT_69190 [Phyllosticta citrichinensis]|uniref:Uncharacterized protein n=1 Tax=Phyllosticta citrichinensis TaxID=1130410 RepID=A0ABR1XGD0_9PEZI